MKYSKKTQIFIFDMIFSFVIIIITFGIVFSYYSSTSKNIDIYELNNNILNSFTKTQINTLNDDYIKELFKLREIRNIQNSVAQQAAEFYYIYTRDSNPYYLELSKNLSENFIDDFLTSELNIEVNLFDGATKINLMNQSASLNSVALDDAELTAVSKRSVYGFMNETHYFGPYKIEVVLWV